MLVVLQRSSAGTEIFGDLDKDDESALLEEDSVRLFCNFVLYSRFL